MEVTSRREADGGQVENTAFLSDVLSGLRQAPKAIPARWFYDDEGSRLFEDITRLPEYYLTRAERRLLVEWMPSLMRAHKPVVLVELGAGSGEKTRLILRAMRQAGRGRWVEAPQGWACGGPRPTPCSAQASGQRAAPGRSGDPPGSAAPGSDPV